MVKSARFKGALDFIAPPLVVDFFVTPCEDADLNLRFLIPVAAR
jgi:hypothetical protein